MALADRRYLRGYTSSFFPGGVKWLLITNTAMFVLYYLFPGPFRPLALAPVGVIDNFAVWQLVTYMFLHGGVTHLLFNMLALWMFGSPLESDWGTRRFLKYYFLCGIGAGICDLVLKIIVGGQARIIPTVGASGAIYGLLLAFGVLYPNQIILFNFLFPIKAKYMVMIYGGVAFLGALGANSGISHIAHLGGMAFGYAYLRLRLVRTGFSWGTLMREFEAWKLRRAKRRFQVYMRKHGSDRDRWVN